MHTYFVILQIVLTNKKTLGNSNHWDKSTHAVAITEWKLVAENYVCPLLLFGTKKYFLDPLPVAGGDTFIYTHFYNSFQRTEEHF